MDVLLTHGWLPIVVQVVTAGVLVAAVGWRSRSWWLRWIPLSLAVGVALAGAAYWLVDYLALADDPAPVELWPWLAMTGVAAVVAIAGWRSARWWRRSVALVAIPMCAMCVALVVDAWTGYLPTVSSAWDRANGAALPTQTDEAGAMDMRRLHRRPAQGTLVSVRIGDDASGFRHRDELVYLPPAWFAGDTTPALPVIVMAGGEFGHPADWPTTGGAQRTADAFAAAHDGNAPVLVFTDTSGEFSNDTECVNGVRGNAADHITKDVVPYVIAHFGTSPDAAHWGIVGWSSGGTCALLTTVMHPELFSAFVDIDGGLGPNAGSKEQTVARLFGGDATAFAAFDPATVMTAHGPYTGPAGWFAVSGTGPVVHRPAGSSPPADQNPSDIDPEDHGAVANYLCALASSDGIQCAVVPQEGDHDFGSAARVFAAALPWLAGRLGTPAAPPIPLPGASTAS
ncbi:MULTISPECIES: alpha/beta hydrolase [unclassified Mycobacterium]|uniref:alpha/beta hydrolase n=1 Tax=unclassified Mycobacterium TaxID=2642494 RepID=UPI0029C6521E|nr:MULTISPECIES: alpha/beta hydrolase-fold protein [unclassified Mycobacterium]